MPIPYTIGAGGNNTAGTATSFGSFITLSGGAYDAIDIAITPVEIILVRGAFNIRTGTPADNTGGGWVNSGKGGFIALAW